MSQESDVEILEGPVVPAEKTPSNTREFFLRPPDWRYPAAVKYLNDELHGITPTIPTDIHVQYAVRVLRAFNQPATRIYMDVLCPDAVETITLGVIMKHSAITADIESCIISGSTTEELELDGFYIRPVVFDLYAKLFCDLSGITAVHAWIHDFLLEPERHSENTTLLKARLMAYYGGKNMGGTAAVTGFIDNETQQLMKQITATEQQKRIFEYVVRATDMRAEDYVAVMEGAVKSMTEKDFQEKMRDREEAGSSSLEELAGHLEEGIRAYSQKELEAINSSGLDFVNQYTPVIIRKEQDDGK